MNLGIVVLLVCFAFFLGYLVGRQNRTKSPKVDPIKHFQPHTSKRLDERKINELQQLINNGQKIQAIKLYRQLTGVGLKEAKESVEQLEMKRKDF
jgi:ribosomal protein L7/L12